MDFFVVIILYKIKFFVFIILMVNMWFLGVMLCDMVMSFVCLNEEYVLIIILGL